MKVNVSPMNYGSLLKKLSMGVALADRSRNVKEISRFNSEMEQKLIAGAVKTGQVDKQFLGLGDSDIMTRLQSGELFPNELFGWSTKTVLAALVVLLLLKVKRLQKK